MFENVALAFQGVWSHKLRSLLTMLGIIIGIASIITIVSTIKGTNEQIKQNLIGSGNNVITVSLNQNGYTYSMDYSSLPDGIETITEDTRQQLEKLNNVKGVSLYRSRNYAENVYYANSAFNGNIYGIDENFFSVNGYTINYGRSFLEEDFKQYRKVIILDSSVVSSLFLGENPIGKTIEIKEEPFTVIGVVSQRVENAPVITSVNDYWMYTDYGSGTMFIPLTCWDIVYRYDEPQSVCIKASNTDSMTKIGTEAADILNENHVTSTTITYKAENLQEQASELQSLSETTNSQLIWIAGISLLVGGIGVMNIMLVSVTERIKEIGLKLAIGARQNRILWQFLTEAATLTSLGGLIGVGAGIGLAYMLSKVMGTPVAISVPACVISLVFSMLIGIVFGLVPAIKASRLNPIDALRHE